MNLADATLEILRDEGVDRIFGNPGTTELPLIDALARSSGGPAYHLALHESAAVAMADGYARATGRVGCVNLHVTAGVANGLGNVMNARRSRTPLLVTAGQQDRRHLDQDPMLAGDTVGIAAPLCKSAVEVTSAADLPAMLRRALAAARTPPEGPVLLSVPVDVLEEELPGELPPRSVLHAPGVAGGVPEAAALLAAAQRPALVAGDGIAREDAVEEALALAEALGAAVYLQAMYDAVPFPTRHPLVVDELAASNAAVERALSGHDVVLVAGARAFSPHYYSQRRAVPAGTRLVQLDSDPAEVGRNHPVDVGLVGALAPTLAALREAAGTHGVRHTGNGSTPPGERAREAAVADGAVPLPVPTAAAALVRALPDDAIVVEEAVTSGRAVRAALRPERRGSYHHAAGGALGWGLGATIGVKLGEPGRPVVGVLGDGAAAYCVQALWSAARYAVDAVFVVLDNREYRAVKQGLVNLGADLGAGHPGTELDTPPLDWGAIAAGFGVPSARPEDAAGVSDAVAAALRAAGPQLVQVGIQGLAA